MEIPAVFVLLALFQYVGFTLRVGAGRARYKVDAPRTTGEEAWERLFRIQQNTLEQLVVFIPGMVLFAHFLGPRWSWIPGLLFVAGRQLYAWEYAKDPKSRGPGMGLTLLANAALLIGAAVGLVIRLV